MRRGFVKAFGLVGVTAAAVVAAVLVLASGGAAAGKNICSVPSPTAASCVTELVAPHFITAGADALSVTKFTNESGNGGGTATHVVLSVGFSSPADSTVPVNVDVKSITLLVNGSAAPLTGCTPTPANLPQTVSTVSCPVGNLAGSGTAKMTVRFAASTTTMLTGTATYGEGSGTPGQPTNSVQGNTDKVTVSGDGSATGGCFDTLPGNPFSGSTTAQMTSITLGGLAADSSQCTFADAGVLTDPNLAPTLHSQISFVEFPALANGAFATVNIQFTPLPAGVNLNKLKLLEDTNYKVPFFQYSITVPNCDKSGNIPAPVGIPAQFATDAKPHSNDSCIFNRSPLPGGGGELDLHVISSPLDGHYGT